jgi:hypothetical protein
MAEDFLDLIKAWEKLCQKYLNGDRDASVKRRKGNSRTSNFNKRNSFSSLDEEEYEVWKLVDICYGDPNNIGNRGLHFKVLITLYLQFCIHPGTIPNHTGSEVKTNSQMHFTTSTCNLPKP